MWNRLLAVDLHDSDPTPPADGHPEPPRLVLRGGVDAAGSPVDVAIDPISGRIVEAGPPQAVPARVGDTVEDCAAMVIVPAGVETHAHLDKALLSVGVPVPDDLDAGVAEWFARAGDLDHSSFVERATAAVEALVARGTTTIRTHVDVAEVHGLRGVHALVEVRDTMRRRGLADIELVGLAAPLGGERGAPVRRLLDEAIEAGIDLVGASPDLSHDPLGATDDVVAAAVRSGLRLDVHTDQDTDPALFHLPALIEGVRRHGLTGAAASHCVSLASQDLDTQRRVADQLAAAGICVFTMPLSSLFLFGWTDPVCPPRGVTSINLLRQAGVVVAAGSDNVQDPFFPFGRCDPFETAGVLALVAHLTAAEAWDMVSNTARVALGREQVHLAPGAQADLVAVEGRDLTAAFSNASETRTVVHRGKVVARSRVSRALVG